MTVDTNDYTDNDARIKRERATAERGIKNRAENAIEVVKDAYARGLITSDQMSQISPVGEPTTVNATVDHSGLRDRALDQAFKLIDPGVHDAKYVVGQAAVIAAWLRDGTVPQEGAGAPETA